MAKWVIATKKADFDAIGEKFHIDPVIARILRNRDVFEEEQIEAYLNTAPEKLYDPFLLKDMEKAVEKLLEAISQRKKIRVIGDYDVDGISAAYILKEGFCMLSADADYRVPNRVKDGYGLNDSMIDAAKNDGVDVIVTCDNGIAAADTVEYANSLGMTVIVTDHHEVPFETDDENNKCYNIPNAYAVVNPKQQECNYPFSGICGATVAYKLIQALFLKKGIKVPASFLEMAAFATICDMMELKDENRILVKCGLESMKRTENIGLRALFQVCEIPLDKLGAYHIGFICGPCFNATGRLDVADRAIELLSAKTFDEAVLIARELKDLNEQRKSMTNQGVQMADEYIASHKMENQDVLLVYLPDCHESIAGIIAGRIKEKYYKPAIVLTDGEESVKGSARSIEAYNIYEKLTECKEYLLKFGGHQKAAGLSLAKENIEPLRQKLNEQSGLTPEEFEEKIVIDVPMPISYVTKELIEQLAMLEPFGIGNEKPVFAQKGVRILSENRVGKAKTVGKYLVSDGYCTREMVYFGDLDAFREFYKAQGTISIVYYPTLNTFRNEEKIELILNAYKEG